MCEVMLVEMSDNLLSNLASFFLHSFFLRLCNSFHLLYAETVIIGCLTIYTYCHGRVAGRTRETRGKVNNGI